MPHGLNLESSLFAFSTVALDIYELYLEFYNYIWM